MNYELAIMALEGLSSSPMRVEVGERGIEIRGSGSSFKELARLCLLLGNEATDEGETVHLQVPVHLAEGSLELRLRRSSSEP
ncbi:MAG TPA: hypothetical protein VMS56_06970 [Thermoanaerobaculia bacterium]|nr:hypothetical protein [Thermoanaerobaculia bacterium]